MKTPTPGPGGSGRRDFATTHWSLVLALRPGAKGAGPAPQSMARQALAELCQAYWYPLYAFVRFRGYAPEEAQDLTQAFFTRLIETESLAGANPEHGRFRSYLLGAMKNFLSNVWHKEQAQKRGGGLRFLNLEALDLDTLDPEAQDALTSMTSEDPDLGFDRAWAHAVLDRALERLRLEYAESGRAEHFTTLKGSLVGEELDRRRISAELDLSAGALKVAIHRLRKRFRAFIRAEIAETVDDPTDVESEMRYLVAILRKSR